MSREIVEESFVVDWTCDLCHHTEHSDDPDMAPSGWLFPASFIDINHSGEPFVSDGPDQCLCPPCVRFLVAATMACTKDRTELADRVALQALDKARRLYK